MLALQHGAAAPLLTLSQQQPPQQQQPGAPTTPKDRQAQSSSAGLEASRKNSCRGPHTQLPAGDHTAEDKDREGGREGDREAQEEEPKDSDSETDTYEERRDAGGAKSSSKARDRHGDLAKSPSAKGGCEGVKESTERSGRLSAPCSSSGAESPSRQLLTPGLSKADLKYHLPPGFMPPLPALHAQSLPFGFPFTNPYFHTGERVTHTHTHTYTQRLKDDT